MVQQRLADAIIIVTGAAGFIGFHVCEAMLKTGATVVGLDNMNSYYDVSLKAARLEILKQQPNFKFEHVELADTNAVSNVFSRYRPDFVVHLAAQAGVRYSIENPTVYVDSNIHGFLSILEACRSFPMEHLVYASSSSVYGMSSDVPFIETQSADKPVSLYAATKRANELMAYSYAHLYDIPSSGLRFFTVYGPWGRPDMAYFKFTKAIIESKPIELYNNGEMERDFTFVDDVVSAIVLLLTRAPAKSLGPSATDGKPSGPPHRILNIGNNNPVPLRRLVSAIEAAAGRTAEIVYLPMQPGDVFRTFASVDAIRAEVDFSPSTVLEDGIASFVSWYRRFYGV